MNTAENTVPAPEIAPGGFPAWMPSMFVKEVRQGLRTRGFVGAFIVFQVLMAVLMLFAVVVPMDDQNPARRTATLTAVDTAFWTLIGVLLLLVTPGRAMVGLRTEIENRSVDLLVLSRLTAWRIVLGKWSSLMAQAVLLLVAITPYGIVRYFGGAVNLTQDFVRGVLLLAASGLLTAAGLWASGLPRIAGIGVAVLIAMFQGISGMGFVRSLMGLPAAGGPPGGLLVPSLIAGLLLFAFCLLGAVRRIAPPAENYSFLARVLGLAALIPVPLAEIFGAARTTGQYFLAFGFCFAGIVCLVELTSTALPMASHCRRLRLGKGMSRTFAIFGLPGWQPAMWYTVIVAGVALVLTFATDILRGDEREQIPRLILAITGGLVFAVATASLFRKSTGGPNLVFFIVIVSMSLVSIGAAITDDIVSGPGHEYRMLAALLPISGVWFTAENFAGETVVVMSQLFGLILWLLLGIRQSQAYWTWTRSLELRIKGPGCDPSKSRPSG